MSHIVSRVLNLLIGAFVIEQRHNLLFFGTSVTLFLSLLCYVIAMLLSIPIKWVRQMLKLQVLCFY